MKPELETLINNQILMHAIVGRGFLSLEDAISMKEQGFATYKKEDESQAEAEWNWVPNSLDKLDTNQLIALYIR